MSPRLLFAALCLIGTAFPVSAEEAGSADQKANEAAELLALNPLSALDKATLDGFRDAPLFTPSRTRPAPPPAAVAEAPPPAPEPVEEAPSEPPTLKLSGIVEGPEGAVAFVAKDGAAAIEQLRLGDQVDGWLVSAIDPQALKLTLEDREQEYRLFVRPEADASAASDEDDAEKSSDDGASDDSGAATDDDAAKDEDEEDSKSGAEREMEAARKAQRNSQRRQRLTPDQIGPE